VAKPQKNSPKKPRFFCDNCGAEVPRDGKRCPNCGRYFASVRCPACGFTGEETLFREGCPVCGYSTTTGNNRGVKESEKASGGGLPLWVYILTSAVFTALMAALFLRLFR